MNPTVDVEGSPTAIKLRILGGQSRYGITKTGFGYRWHEHDQRFDAARHPNEPNRFGWVVEIDRLTRAASPTYGAGALQARGGNGDPQCRQPRGRLHGGR